MIPKSSNVKLPAKASAEQVVKDTDSTIHVVAGLLLPIWKRLPNESTRVYQLQTDAGERIVGRKVSPAWVATALATDAPVKAMIGYSGSNAQS